MNKQFHIITLLFMAELLLSSFGAKEEQYELSYPKSWPDPVYDFSRNPLSPEGIELGRRLFYDPILSADSSVSCANCHLSFTAFTHVDHALSHGINDSVGTRNSMTLMNMAWSNSFMWDGAVNHMDMQALAPISHPAEMGSSISDAVTKIKKVPSYASDFKKVFGTDQVSGERVLKSLAQFQLTLVSANSKYDKVMRDEPEVQFSEQEKKGYVLFQSHCNSCHQEPLFTTGEFENNGLDQDPFLKDLGRMTITKNPMDSMKFKVPTLRNIEFSRPYMHDGRFKSLTEVMGHYSSPKKASPTVSLSLSSSEELSSNDRVDIIAFLLTLSDKEFLFNPNHSFPRN